MGNLSLLPINYIINEFDYLNYSILIEFNKSSSDYQLGDWTESKFISDQILTKVCNTVSMGYRGIAVLHTHQKVSKGGMYYPHIHLLLFVPIEEQLTFDARALIRLRDRDKKGIFKLIPNDLSLKWDIDEYFQSSRYVRNWKSYVKYLVGEKRRNPPRIIWIRENHKLRGKLEPSTLIQTKPWHTLKLRLDSRNSIAI